MPRTNTKTGAPKTKCKVDFVRCEVHDSLAGWERIKAAITGEHAVKCLGEKVLPMPNAFDTTVANRSRYNAYMGRAVWYNASGRTLEALTGYVFSKEPVVTLPATMKTVEENVDGSGVTLAQQAKACLRNVLAYGRAGLLVDYPTRPANAVTTKADLLEGKVSPTICLYEPDQIVNWKTVTVGALVILEMLVLKEHYAVDTESEFEQKSECQYRVLKRNGGKGVTGHIYRKKGAGAEADWEEVPELAYAPSDSTGKPLDEIYFIFVGAQNNNATVDVPPMQDLVNLNFAHFRNSADFEEACFMVGQPTPWVSGLTQAWVDDVLKGQIFLGSRAVIPLPPTGTAGLLQAEANTMPFEAMKHKETQMVALGAKLVQDKEVQRTATEAGMDHTAEVSTLVSCANNVFKAYEEVLGYAAELVGNAETGIAFELSEPLNQGSMPPEQATAIMAMWQGQIIDFEEARDLFKKAGWAWKEDDEVKAANEVDNMDGGLPAPEPGAKPKPPAPPPPKPGGMPPVPPPKPAEY